MIVHDTPESIDFFRLAALKGALRLEIQGLRKKGASALTIAKQMGYKGNRKQVLEQVIKDVEARKAKPSEASQPAGDSPLS